MLIKRKITGEIRKHLAEPEITMIVGPRQAGKTTLMRELERELVCRGEKIVWLNLDIERDRQHFVSQEVLLKKIKYEIGESGYVFVDEIQRKTDAGLFLKGLYDMELDYKWVVSGSGSLELKEKIGESLAGRKRIFELSTLSFGEVVEYKEKYRGSVKELGELDAVKLERYWDEYLQYGGYPRVVLAETAEEKRREIEEIYQSYIEKDLILLLRIEKSESLVELLRLLSTQAGQLVNLTELSNTLNLATATVKKYLWYLEKTFMISKVTPYYKNVRKEIAKAPMYYFVDLGMCNFVAGRWKWEEGRDGFLAQNYVYLQLKDRIKHTASTIHFWRTQDGAEVDFVVNDGGLVVPWEVKDKVLKRPEITRSFRSFLTKYSPEVGYVVSRSELLEEKVGETRVELVSFWGMSGWLSGLMVKRSEK